MKKLVILPAVLIATGALSLAANHGHFQKRHAPEHSAHVILSFGTMYGVEGPLLGEANAIRGIAGDEAPWEIAQFIRGRLFKDGRLQILVRGLVFGDDPLVDPELVGKNDEETFRGVVSCLTEDESEGIVTANVTTAGFPATELGNSFINEKLELPNPCIAPIVFVLAGSEDKWFAVTGFETEE